MDRSWWIHVPPYLDAPKYFVGSGDKIKGLDDDFEIAWMIGAVNDTLHVWDPDYEANREQRDADMAFYYQQEVNAKPSSSIWQNTTVPAVLSLSICK
ncbi:MAG: hypothetical protein LBG28_06610, partial [Tannerella sp.]|nr:hypothetical protein [Tannerella sp.]